MKALEEGGVDYKGKFLSWAKKAGSSYCNRMGMML